MDREKKVILLLFILVSSVFLLCAGGYFYAWDTETKYQVTKSIVDKGRFDVEPSEMMVHLKEGKDGLYYSKFPLGTTLLFVPFYAATKFAANTVGLDVDLVSKFVLSLINVFVSAFTVLVLYSFLRYLKFSTKAALLTVLTYAFATMAWVYSSFSRSEVVVALLFISAVYAAAKFKDTNKTSSLLLSGLFTGLIFLFKFESIIVFPAFILFLFLLSKPKQKDVKKFADLGLFLKNTALFSIAALPSFIMWVVYNFVKYGDMFETGYSSGEVTALINPVSISLIVGSLALVGALYFVLKNKKVSMQSLISDHFVKLVYLFFLAVILLFLSNPNFLNHFYVRILSVGRGIFFYSAPLLLFFFGINKFYKEKKEVSVLIISSLLIFLLFFIVSELTTHGWGSRYAFPIHILMMIPIASLFSQKNSRLMRNFIILVLILGVIVQVLGFTVDHIRAAHVQRNLYGNEDDKFIENIQYDPAASPILVHAKVLKALVFDKGIVNVNDKELHYKFDFWMVRLSDDFPKPLLAGISAILVLFALISAYFLKKEAKSL